ncbi:MAG TPA: DUF1570 domain-containing protein [Pirellulales bacterium]|nr:DUF1570 domain-containing protein [Pirellulales bacterium]
MMGNVRGRSKPPRRIAIGGVGLWLVCACAMVRADETIASQHRALVQQNAQALEALAQWCEGNGLDEQAGATRDWIVPQAPLTLVVALPPVSGEAEAAAPDDESPPVRQWRQQFENLRRTQAEHLFELALLAAEQREFTLAYQVVHETLRENPAHERARLLLGYKQHDGRWLTPYEVTKAQSQQVWHPRFGWLPESQVARYESGERRYRGRWVAAADETAARANLERGWEVVTEHYQIRTNHSLEAGVRLAKRLERFYGAWRQVFARFVLNDEQWDRLFREGVPTGSVKRHQIVLFRNRGEFIQALEREQPSIRISTGYYSPKSRKAFYFVGSEEDDSTLYHEATHQLFAEIHATSRDAGRDTNFWIVEGVACWIESFRPQGGLGLIGGVAATRLRNARTRLTRDHFYLPLGQLAAMSVVNVQQNPQISMIYSESAGITYFLMFADEGRYREPLVDFLNTVYAKRDKSTTLAELTGVEFHELDRRYREFIEDLPDPEPTETAP